MAGGAGRAASANLRLSGRWRRVMAAPNAWRSRAGIGIVLSMAALAVCTFVSFCSLFERNNADAHAIPMDGARFREIRALLPAHGTVGYLGDFGGEPENTRAYYKTQYF